MLIPISMLRAEGLTTGEASDARLTATLALVEEYVRLVTRQTFESLTFDDAKPLLVDGTGTDTLDLPIPILSLGAVTEDWDPSTIGVVVPIADLRVYGERKPRDDRRYPRIVKVPAASSMYLTPIFGQRSPVMWMRGRRNVALTGTFGYLDGNWRGAWDAGTAYAAGDTTSLNGQDYLALTSSTGTAPGTDETKWQTGAAPAPIRQVAVLLALREYRLKTDPLYAAATQKARVTSETTDGHSYSLAGMVASGGLTGDPLIDDILMLYTNRSAGGSTGDSW